MSHTLMTTAEILEARKYKAQAKKDEKVKEIQTYFLESEATTWSGWNSSKSDIFDMLKFLGYRCTSFPQCREAGEIGYDRNEYEHSCNCGGNEIKFGKTVQGDRREALAHPNNCCYRYYTSNQNMPPHQCSSRCEVGVRETISLS